jgi:hypothetical protein
LRIVSLRCGIWFAIGHRQPGGIMGSRPWGPSSVKFSVLEKNYLDIPDFPSDIVGLKRERKGGFPHRANRRFAKKKAVSKFFDLKLLICHDITQSFQIKIWRKFGNSNFQAR